MAPAPVLSTQGPRPTLCQPDPLGKGCSDGCPPNSPARARRSTLYFASAPPQGLQHRLVTASNVTTRPGVRIPAHAATADVLSAQSKAHIGRSAHTDTRNRRGPTHYRIGDCAGGCVAGRGRSSAAAGVLLRGPRPTNCTCEQCRPDHGLCGRRCPMTTADRNMAAGHAVTARRGDRVAGPAKREPQELLLAG